MATRNKNFAGVSRDYGPALIQKCAFIVGHFAAIYLCIWLLYYNGLTVLAELSGQHWTFSDPLRAKILLSCAFLYFLRHIITLFYLLQRKVSWSEVMGLLVFISGFEISLLLVGGGVFRENAIQLSWLDISAIVLVLVGSLLNSLSEIQRKLWKRNPNNKGHCYSAGLFAYSKHINYFGDSVLFTGWCLLTVNLWTLALPLFITAMFVFYHIPSLDDYLLFRYGEEFKRYSEKTKRLIPFIY